MKHKIFIIQLIIRVLLLSATLSFSIYFYSKTLYFTCITFVVIFFLLLLECYHFYSKQLEKIHQIILAMLYEDYSLKFPEKSKSPLFLNDLGKLYDKSKTEHFENYSTRLIYENIFNGLDTGFIILRKKEAKSWEIYLMNRKFMSILQVPNYLSWQNFSQNQPKFASLIESFEEQEINRSLDLSVNGEEEQTFSLKTSLIKTYEFHYYIVSVDSVQNIVERKEKEAWYNLMKVISHEMMNTLTPINSLVGNLEHLMPTENWNPEDKSDFNESLKTIQKKSIHLLEFVDNYRQLANFPAPDKKQENIIDLINSCIQIMQPMLTEKKIQIANLKENHSPVILNFDSALIERVLINLITNSMYALDASEKTDKQITIDLELKNGRCFVQVKDNGIGVDTSIRNKIFIPFYTTRENGVGIGLTLSKNIMEAHNGNMTFRSNQNETVFSFSLVQ